MLTALDSAQETLAKLERWLDNQRTIRLNDEET
jgi:hypothetical protein